MQSQTQQAANRKQIIMDKSKRINLKSKRTRTLIRKAIEVSQMCNLDVFIVLRDRDFGKVIEYNSISADGQAFTIKGAEAVLDKYKSTLHRRNFKQYTDADYENLKVHHRNGDLFDSESLIRQPVKPCELLATKSLEIEKSEVEDLTEAFKNMEKNHNQPNLRREPELQFK